MKHICVSKLNIIGTDNGRRQAIIWTNAAILLNGAMVPNFNEIEIDTFSFKKIHLKMSTEKGRQSYLHFNVWIDRKVSYHE